MSVLILLWVPHRLQAFLVSLSSGLVSGISLTKMPGINEDSVISQEKQGFLREQCLEIKIAEVKIMEFCHMQMM